MLDNIKESLYLKIDNNREYSIVYMLKKLYCDDYPKFNHSRTEIIYYATTI